MKYFAWLLSVTRNEKHKYNKYMFYFYSNSFWQVINSSISLWVFPSYSRKKVMIVAQPNPTVGLGSFLPLLFPSSYWVVPPWNWKLKFPFSFHQVQGLLCLYRLWKRFWHGLSIHINSLQTTNSYRSRRENNSTVIRDAFMSHGKLQSVQ